MNTKPQEEWKSEFREKFEARYKKSDIYHHVTIDWFPKDVQDFMFNFISTHFIHRESLKGWLEGWLRPVNKDGYGLLNAEDIIVNETIQSVIQHIEEKI